MRRLPLLQIILCAALAEPAALASAQPASLGPPPNLLFQLQKENRRHPWLRVASDAGRFELLVDRLDERGFSGFHARSTESALPRPIAWPRVARVDEVVTAAGTQATWGAIAGGLAGALLMNMTTPDQSNTTVPLGLAVGAGVGGLLGYARGEGRVRERPWYVREKDGVPWQPAASGTGRAIAGGAAEPDTAGAPARVAAPPVAATLGSRTTPSPAVLRACNRVHSDDVVLLRHDLGEFRGTVDIIGPEGLEGFHLQRTALGGGHLATPAGRVSWDQVRRLDRRGNSWSRGALIGAGLFGAAGFLVGLAYGAFAFSSDAEVIGAGLYGALVAGGIGAGVGGVIGASVPRWHLVYRNP